MSITSPDDRISEYNPVVATTDFPAVFPVFDNDDIAVFVDGVERDDFAVTATYAEGISTNAKAVFAIGVVGHVQVVGARDPHRTNRFQPGGPLPPRDLNLAFDTLEAEVQEVHRDVERALKVPLGSSPLGIPEPEDNTVLGWDGENLVNKDPATFVNEAGFATAAQGLLADTSLQRVATIDALVAIVSPLVTAVFVTDPDRGGVFVRRFGDYAARVTSDPSRGIYAPSVLDPLGLVGCWVRLYDGRVFARWFGLTQAAIQAANALADDITIDRNFPIITTATWPNGKNYLFLGAGRLSVANAVTLTIRGVVLANLQKIFYLTGTGIVLGIRGPHIAWWGPVGDGVADDQPQLQAAIRCLEGSDTSDGGHAELFLSGGKNYGLGSTWVIQPTATIQPRILGAGIVLGTATAFTALPSFSGSSNAVIWIKGQTANTVPAITYFEIGNFRIDRVSGSAAVGIQVGGDTAGTLYLQGLHKPCVLRDVYVKNFTYGFLFQACRLVDGIRLSCENTTASTICYGVQSNGAYFTGDLNFINCQAVAFFGATPSGSGWDIRANNAGGGIAGVRFSECLFYGGQFGLSGGPTGGAYVSDMWVNPGCQFEAQPFGGIQTSGVALSCSGSGSRLFDIHVTGCYFSGNGYYRPVSMTVSGSGVGFGWFVRGNFIANALNNGVYTSGNGGSLKGLGLDSNIGHGHSTSPLVYTEVCTQFTASFNVIKDVVGAVSGAVVQLGGGTNWATAIGNNSGGNATVSILNNGAGANNCIPAGTNI